MRTLRRIALLLCVPLLWIGAALAQGDFYLKDGDRVVFYGDSITDQRLYTTFAETYVVTRFPRMKVGFVHSGWGGDRVGGGGGGPIHVRLNRDVFAYKPTVMTIMLGMNDGRYRAFDPEIFETYASGYRYMVSAVKNVLPGIRITVIEPSPYDDVTQPPKFEGGYNAVLLRYAEFVKQLARQENLNVADLNGPVVGALKRAKATDATLAQKIIPDRVHPGPGGHLLMAEALLKSWNAPAVVTSVEIDAEQKRVTRVENTQVSDLRGDKGLSWTQTDAALPMPFDNTDTALALAVQSSDFVDALDRQPLKISGLAAGRYTLWIDHEGVGSFTSEQLARGINLAVLSTPMFRQAGDVHMLTRKHNHVHFMRWRQFQVPFEDDRSASMQAALTALDALEADLIQQQRAAAQPKPRRYELARE